MTISIARQKDSLILRSLLTDLSNSRLISGSYFYDLSNKNVGSFRVSTENVHTVLRTFEVGLGERWLKYRFAATASFIAGDLTFDIIYTGRD